MDCFIINVTSAHSRMNFMTEQIKKLGMSFDRLEAITPETIDNTINSKYWNTWERPMKETEKACFLSHLGAWEKVSLKHGPVLILEDDTLLSQHVPKVLEAVADRDDFDHLTLEVRKRNKIVAKTSFKITNYHTCSRLYQDRSGAAAYILWPSGAEKLLRRSKKQSALADAMICKAYELRSYQVEPACAVQLDKANEYEITPPINIQSLIDAGVSTNRSKKEVFFRMRRIGAQVRMAIHALRHITYAQRREINLKPADFIY